VTHRDGAMSGVVQFTALELLAAALGRLRPLIDR
jgi:hypothetical protein